MVERGKVVLSVLLFCGIIIVSMVPAQAVEYLGDFCWQSPDGSIAVLGVTHMGGNHFLLTGKVVESSAAAPVLRVEPMHGNAEIVGTSIYLSLVNTGGDSSGLWGYFIRIVLSAATFNGTVYPIGLEHNFSSPNPENATPTYGESFDITYVSCP